VISRANAGAQSAAALNAPVVDKLLKDFDNAAHQAVDLKSYRYIMNFTAGESLDAQAEVAVAALSEGISRCVTLASGFLWDSHVENDDTQTQLWETLFQGLGRLMTRLSATPGRNAPTLADETVVVVLSEMGRTPLLNGFGGKDHWPYTSAMIVGPGITGSRVVGAYDDYFYGRPIDPASGELYEGGELLSAESLGATLLMMGGVDPAEIIRDANPIPGLMS